MWKSTILLVGETSDDERTFERLKLPQKCTFSGGQPLKGRSSWRMWLKEES